MNITGSVMGGHVAGMWCAQRSAVHAIGNLDERHPIVLDLEVRLIRWICYIRPVEIPPRGSPCRVVRTQPTGVCM